MVLIDGAAEPLFIHRSYFFCNPFILVRVIKDLKTLSGKKLFMRQEYTVNEMTVYHKALHTQTHMHTHILIDSQFICR